MKTSSSTDLKITLTLGGRTRLETPDLCSVTWEADMDNCNIHAWMTLFEQVLLAEGFAPQTIMDGACQLAFSECRSDADMKAVADKYGLTLQMLALDTCA